MKKPILLALILCFNYFFTQKIDYTFKNKNSTLKYELLINGEKNFSQWKMLTNARGEIINNINFFFVKKNNEYFFADKTLIEKILVKDSISLKWKKHTEIKNILGYTCNSAITSFRGRDYTVFYTKDIKIDAGPWKFSGLEGLILKVESKDGLYSFEATNIDLNQPKIDYDFINKVLSRNFIEWHDYVKLYKKSVNETVNNEQCNCPEDGKNILKVSKIEKIYPILQEGLVY